MHTEPWGNCTVASLAHANAKHRPEVKVSESLLITAEGMRTRDGDWVASARQSALWYNDRLLGLSLLFFDETFMRQLPGTQPRFPSWCVANKPVGDKSRQRRGLKCQPSFREHPGRVGLKATAHPHDATRITQTQTQAHTAFPFLNANEGGGRIHIGAFFFLPP